MTKRIVLIMVALSGVLAVLSLVSLVLGRYSASVPDQLRVAFGLPSATMDADQREVLQQLLFAMRLPRIAAALLVGVALAMAGAAFQAMFRNPLVSPDLLGVTAGSAFGVILGVVLESNPFAIQLLSFGFGTIAVLFTLAVARAYHRGDKVLILVLAGIICAAMFSSLSYLLIYTVEPESISSTLEYWLDGGLGMAKGSQILLTLPMFALGVAGLLASGKALNVLSLGEEASTLGVNPFMWRVIAVGSATLISSLTVTLAGIIAWIGLVTPHFARLIVGSDNRALLPVSAIVGAIVLLVADDCTRSLFVATIPTSLSISVVCIPIFMGLLYRRKRGAFHV
jgi:iron complex transport system permease protein